jgi:hypothetical protein
MTWRKACAGPYPGGQEGVLGLHQKRKRGGGVEVLQHRLAQVPVRNLRMRLAGGSWRSSTPTEVGT